MVSCCFVCLCCVPTLCLHTSVDICINAGSYSPSSIINPRRACAARVAVVVVCVCQSAGLSVCVSPLLDISLHRFTNNTTYSASGIGQKVCGVFSATAGFESYGVKQRIALSKQTLSSRTSKCAKSEPRAGPLALCILKA